MLYLLAISVAFFASILTFFTGFGLGTILLPAFLLLLPVELALTATASVHLLNNIAKLSLLLKQINWQIVLRFGLPAFLSAFAGAWILTLLLELPPLLSSKFLDLDICLSPLKLSIAILMTTFALLELSGKAEKWLLPAGLMPLGGILSGFFGGLSGHQGAFRSMFLLKAGLSKEEFVGTGAAIAFLVDTSRIFVYSKQLASVDLSEHALLLLASGGSAILGTLIGKRLLKKITLKNIEMAAALVLILISLLLALGLI